jgi:hypothetical protein
MRFRKPKQLEGSIEKKCCDDARALKVVGRKMNGMGFAAWPDRLFICPPKNKITHFWVEFKRPDEGPTPLQRHVHRDLRRRGQLVFVIDNRHDFEKLLNRLVD